MLRIPKEKYMYYYKFHRKIAKIAASCTQMHCAYNPASGLTAVVRSDDSCGSRGSSRVAAFMIYSAFLEGLGVDISVIVVLFASISAAHRAAPTVLVKEKKMPATGTNSSRVATVPNAV